VFLANTWRLSFKKPFRFHLLLDQMEQIGVASVPIIALSSLAIGMIFALQMVSLLQPFRAEIMTGMAVAKANARELAPVITALMLIGKNGSSMAAEIGTMKVTEQIDAMETMSVNPIHYLVVPRIFAAVVMFPMLTLLANVIGVFGAYLISVVAMGVEEATYLHRMFQGLRPVDITSGLIKAGVMGYIVTVICTYFGFNADNGAKGVGDSSTQAVVTASVAILVADYIMASIMMAVMY
jgi:phospholipid/cholesterol/gamma-HCH transport system permease protein